MSKKYKKSEALYAGYEKRNVGRRGKSTKAVIDLVVFFMTSGDDLATANDKVDQVSHRILKDCPHGMIGMEKGNSRCKSDLIAAIEGLTIEEFPFMTVEAKELFKNDLTGE